MCLGKKLISPNGDELGTGLGDDAHENGREEPFSFEALGTGKTEEAEQSNSISIKVTPLHSH